MTKLGVYKNIIEGIMTIGLVFVFPFSFVFKIKLVLLYFIIMHLAGRYRGRAILIWDELKLLLLGYMGYIGASLLLLDYDPFSWGQFGWLVLYLLCHGFCNLLIARYTHVVFGTS